MSWTVNMGDDDLWNRPKQKQKQWNLHGKGGEGNRETIVKKIKIKNKSSNTKQKILEFGWDYFVSSEECCVVAK